jgi:hypothetical protein
LNSVIVEKFLVADEADVFGQRLRDEDSVERVFVMARQKARSLAMIDCYGQLPETQRSHIIGEPKSKFFGLGQFAKSNLRCELPRGCRADEYLRVESQNG